MEEKIMTRSILAFYLFTFWKVAAEADLGIFWNDSFEYFDNFLDTFLREGKSVRIQVKKLIKFWIRLY